MPQPVGLPTLLVIAAAGLVLVGVGAWALVDSASFFDRLAVFPPYNAHFIHDIGAFQVGLGLALWLALVWTDAILAVLVANAIAASLHVGTHFVDRNLGGDPVRDITTLGLLALVLLVLAALRFRRLRA